MKAGRTAGRNAMEDPQGLRPAGRASEESDDHPARPEANASARMRDDLRAGAKLRPRVSDRHGEADETRAAAARWSAAK